jgi:hypothetical protein
LASQNLNQAIEYLKAGRVVDARHMLSQIVKAEPRNVNAWMWYVETFSSTEKKIEALENCVLHNPEDKLAIKALTTLRGKFPNSTQQVAEQPIPAEPPSKPEKESPSVVYVEPKRKRLSRKMRLAIVICIVEVFLMYVIGVLLTIRTKPNRNILAVGELAVVEEVNVAIQKPMELDGKRKSGVYVLRAVTANRYPELLARKYRPADQVFGMIENNLPWWGITGQFYYGPGERSIEGPSEESRFLTNPYMLVAADPVYTWNGRVTENQVLQDGFQFLCDPPRRLLWYPQESQAYLTYSAQCASKLGYRQIDLIAYNARDLNLKYIYVSYADSLNVTKQEIPESAIEIPHYIHQGDSCGYPKGCNNLSPATPELDGLLITGFPAQIVIWLWEEKPNSVDQEPDMVYVIRFE